MNLKKLSKSTVHFTTCWCLLIFSNPTYAFFDGWKDSWTRAKDRVRLWVNASNSVETKELTRENNTGGARSVHDPNYTSVMPSLGCSPMKQLNLEFNEFDSLVGFLEANSCDNEAIATLKESSRDGSMNAVALCQELFKFKEEGYCGEAKTFSGMDYNLLVHGLEKNAELKKLREKQVKDNLKEDLKKMKATSKLQMELSTDPIVMSNLYSYLSNSQQTKEEMVESLGLEEGFVDRLKSNNVTMDDFAQNIFGCLPTDAKFKEIDSDFNSFQCSHVSTGILPGQGERDNIFDQAKKDLLTECQDGSCGFTVDKQEEIFTGILSSLSDELKALGASGKYSNVAMIDPNLGLKHLENSHVFLGEVLRYKQGKPGNFLDNMATHYEDFKNLDEDQLREKMKQKAFSNSLVIINESADELSSGSRRADFSAFIQSKSPNGFLNIERYNEDYLKRQIHGFLVESKGSDEGISSEDLDVYCELTQQLAVGQNLGDYFVTKQKDLTDNLSRYSTLFKENEDGKSTFQSRADSIYQKAVSGEFSPQATARSIRQLGGDQEGKSIWRAAVELEGLQSSDSEPHVQAAYGMKSLMDLLKESEGRANDFIEKNPNGEVAQLGEAGRLKSIQDIALFELAMRSMSSCKEIKDQKKRTSRYCSPLGNAEFAAKALEVALGEDSEVNPTRLIDSGVALCMPILNEDYNRRLDAQGVKRFTDDRERWSNDYCSKLTTMAVCGPQGCGDQTQNLGVGIIGIQNDVFGANCPVISESNTKMTASGEEIVETNVSGGYKQEAATEIIMVQNSGRGGSLAQFAPSKSIRGRSRSTGGKKKNFRNRDSQYEAYANKGSAPLNQGRSIASVNPSDSRSESTPEPSPTQGQFNTGFQSQYQTTSSIASNFLPEDSSLSETLGEQRDELDPTTRALLAKYEKMEAELARLSKQKETTNSSSELEGIEALLAQSEKKIKDLENKLLQKEDVQKALEVANKQLPVVAATPAAVATPASRSGLITSSASSSPTPAAQPTVAAAPVAAPVGGSGFQGGASPSATRGADSSGDGYYESAGGYSGSSVTPDFSDRSIVLSLNEVKGSSTIVPAGTSPDAAVLDAKRPILIPIGDGQFRLYEPELTADGEVVQENGEVKYKRVVIVADEQALAEIEANKGRVPASIALPEEEPVEDPSRRIFRLDELDNILDREK